MKVRSKSVYAALLGIAIGFMLAVPMGAYGIDGPGKGFLKVNSNPAVPTTVNVNGIPMDGWGIKKVPLPVGSYEISFTDVPGYNTPAPVMVPVTEGETTNVVGDFTKLGLLRVVTEPAVMSTISVDGIPRDEYGLWMYMEPGRHTVSFGSVGGYDPPPDKTVRVRAGDATTVTGVFAENPDAMGPVGVGYLRVTSSPAVPTTVSVNGIPRDCWGLSWLKLAPGVYEVSFSDVPDYSTPAPQVVEVKECEVANVVGSFVQEGGLLVITDPPNAATTYIDGIARDSWGVWLTLPAGTYTVSFGDFPGHVTPPPETVLVMPGQITLVIGEY